MNFKVYETVTGNDVTQEKEWYVDADGYLYYMTNDVDSPLYVADGQYYYKMEIRVYQ